MRVNIRVTIFFTAFILLCAAPGLSSELLQVETQGMGLLSLPPEWRVVSKDETPERNVISDWVLNVQKVLYARAEYVSADAAQDAVLQIFSIWGSDEYRNEKPLPEGMLEAGSNLVSGLIGARYGYVSKLDESVVETVLESLSVVTYEIERFRYKYTFLYHGEKRVLVLLKYRPEFENYWRGHFSSLLNEWVGSLTLTPMRLPFVAPALSAPPPAFLTPPLREPSEGPLTVQQPGQAVPASDRIAWLVPLLVVFLVVCTLAAYMLTQKIQKTQKEEPGASAVPSLVPAEEDNNVSPETSARALAVMLPTFEEWLEEKSLVPRQQPTPHVPPGSPEGGGFDKVHNLLDKALSSLEESAGPK